MPLSALPLPPTPPLPAMQRLLLIDGQRAHTQLLGSVLSGLCSIHVEGTAAAGWSHVQQDMPDLIVLNTTLPDQDGFALMRQLKADPRTAPIPVIVLSAADDHLNEELALNLGAVDFITYPFRAPILQARVRNHLELARQRLVLARLSHTDGLTGVVNRRHFNTMLSREFSRMQRQNAPLALVLIDVDDFQAYNAHYGHLQGDECLQRIAQAISLQLQRPGDLVSRYGGEEFACLLPDTDAAGGLLCAQAILDSVRALQLPHATSRVARTVTVSAGVAAALPHQLRNAQHLLALADAQLHQAKQSGRDRAIADGAR